MRSFLLRQFTPLPFERLHPQVRQLQVGSFLLERLVAIMGMTNPVLGRKDPWT